MAILIITKPENLSFHISEEHKVRQSPDFEALKCEMFGHVS